MSDSWDWLAIGRAGVSEGPRSTPRATLLLSDQYWSPVHDGIIFIRNILALFSSSAGKWRRVVHLYSFSHALVWSHPALIFSVTWRRVAPLFFRQMNAETSLSWNVHRQPRWPIPYTGFVPIGVNADYPLFTVPIETRASLCDWGSCHQYPNSEPSFKVTHIFSSGHLDTKSVSHRPAQPFYMCHRAWLDVNCFTAPCSLPMWICCVSPLVYSSFSFNLPPLLYYT